MKVSIITVCFNSAATIEHTIKSVLSQTYKNVEYIIIDGNSTDNTKVILDQYKASLSVIVSEPDKGLYDAMNKGLKLATGNIIGILNSDDFYQNEYVLEKVVNKFSAETDAVYGDIVYVDKNNLSKVIRYWHAGNFKKYKMKFGWMPPHPAFFVKKTVYQSFGSFNTAFKSSADYELMLRFIYKNAIRIEYLKELLVCMRDGGQGNASIKNRLRANREDSKAWLVNDLKSPIMFRVMKPLFKIPQFIFKRKER